jgi:hypothetical protein
MPQKYLFISKLCTKMSRVNKALKEIQNPTDVTSLQGNKHQGSIPPTFFVRVFRTNGIFLVTFWLKYLTFVWKMCAINNGEIGPICYTESQKNSNLRYFYYLKPPLVIQGIEISSTEDRGSPRMNIIYLSLIQAQGTK